MGDETFSDRHTVGRYRANTPNDFVPPMESARIANDLRRTNIPKDGKVHVLAGMVCMPSDVPLAGGKMENEIGYQNACRASLESELKITSEAE